MGLKGVAYLRNLTDYEHGGRGPIRTHNGGKYFVLSFRNTKAGELDLRMFPVKYR
jgi:hypothetical protein